MNAWTIKLQNYLLRCREIDKIIIAVMRAMNFEFSLDIESWIYLNLDDSNANMSNQTLKSEFENHVEQKNLNRFWIEWIDELNFRLAIFTTGNV